MHTGVIVAVRVRPRNQTETHPNPNLVADSTGSRVQIRPPSGSGVDDEGGGGEGFQDFHFDKVYDTTVRQEDVYTDLGKPLVDRAFEWYNGTIFAYGQTGSGKTHSMLGPDNAGPDDVGIIPRLVDDIFKRAAVRNQLALEDTKAGEPVAEWQIRATYLEIYQERVVDLLAAQRAPHQGGNAKLRIRSHPETGCYVEGALEPVVGNVEEMRQLMREGDVRRRVASHSLNERSSRSHAVFTIKLFQVINAAGRQVHQHWSRINLCDLAGSERQKDTHAEGVRLAESSNINKGLLTLQRVIAALAKNTRNPDRAAEVVPFRESKLTQLLSESLGGSALCSMLACVSPASASLSQTLSTLKYARSARLIKLHVEKNRELLEVDRLKDEVEELRRAMENARVEEKDALVAEYEGRVNGLEAVIARAAAAQDDYRRQLHEERKRQLEALSTPARVAMCLKGRRGDFAGRLTELEGRLSAAESEYHQQRRFVRRLEGTLQTELDAYKAGEGVTSPGGGAGGGERAMEGMLVKLRTAQAESARLRSARERIKELYADLATQAEAEAEALRSELPESAAAEAAAHAAGAMHLSLEALAMGGSMPLSPIDEESPVLLTVSAWGERDDDDEGGSEGGDEEEDGRPKEEREAQAALVGVLELRQWAAEGATRLRKAEGEGEADEKEFSIPDLMSFVAELPESGAPGDEEDGKVPPEAALGSAKLAWGDTRALDMLGYAVDVIERSLAAAHARKEARLDDLVEENRRLTGEVYRLTQLLSMKETELEEIAMQHDDVMYTVEAANHEIDQLMAQVRSVEEEKRAAVEAQERVDVERLGVEAELVKVRRANAALELEQEKRVEEEAGKAREELNVYKAERDALEEKLNAVMAGQYVEGKSSEALTKALQDVESDRATVTTEVRTLREKVEEREKELAEGRVSLHAREAEVRELQAAVRAKTDALEQAMEKQGDVAKELSSAKLALHSAEERMADLREAEKQVSEKERRLAGAEGRSEADAAERARILEQLKAAEAKAETIDEGRRKALAEAEMERERAARARAELEALQNKAKSRGCSIM